jgi:hypothetical protein
MFAAAHFPVTTRLSLFDISRRSGASVGGSSATLTDITLLLNSTAVVQQTTWS